MKDNWPKGIGEIRAEKLEPNAWLEWVSFSPGKTLKSVMDSWKQNFLWSNGQLHCLTNLTVTTREPPHPDLKSTTALKKLCK